MNLYYFIKIHIIAPHRDTAGFAPIRVWRIRSLAKTDVESGVIPFLASPQGGEAASSRKIREATEADAAGVVFLLYRSENHPGLAIIGCCATFVAVGMEIALHPPHGSERTDFPYSALALGQPPKRADG